MPFATKILKNNKKSIERTQATAEILSGKNEGAFLVCGFLKLGLFENHT